MAVAAALATGAFFWVRPGGRTTPSQATDVAVVADVHSGTAGACTASIESKDYRAALAYADEVLRVSPDDREAIRIRESARAMLTRFDEAIARVGQRLAAGDTDGATSALDSARAIDPSAPIVGELSARLAGQARAPEAARTGQQPSKSAASSAASAPQARRDQPVEAPRPGAADSRASAEPAPAATGPTAGRPVTPQPTRHGELAVHVEGAHRNAERSAASAIGERRQAASCCPSRSVARRRRDCLRPA